MRARCMQKSFRVPQITFVTALLEPALWPAKEILSTYG